MADDIAASRAAIAGSRAAILASVPEPHREEGAELLDGIDKKLEATSVAVSVQARTRRSSETPRAPWAMQSCRPRCEPGCCAPDAKSPTATLSSVRVFPFRLQGCRFQGSSVLSSE